MKVALVMTELRAAQAMLRAVFYRATSKQRISTTWFLLGWALLAAVGALFTGKYWGVLTAGLAGLPLAMLALMWWFFLLTGIAPQVFGVSRLVPRTAARAVGVVIAAFAIMAIGMGALISLSGAPFALTACLVALVLITTAAMMAVPWGVFAFLAGCLAQSYWSRDIGAGLRSLGLQGWTALALAAVMLVAFGLWRRASDCWRRRISPFAWFEQPGQYSGTGDPGRSLPAHSLQRACASGDAGQLMMMALGPRATAQRILAGMVIGFALALIPYLALWRGGPELTVLMRVLAVGFLFVLQCTYATVRIDALRKTIREQALIRLTAAAPAATRFNRVLGRRMLLDFGLRWSVLVGLALLAFFAMGGSAGDTLRLLPACAMSLFAAGVMLRDYSEGSKGRTLSNHNIVPCVLATLVLVLTAQFDVLTGSAWYVLGAGVALAALCFARYRWNAMLHAPVAFPVGRFG